MTQTAEEKQALQEKIKQWIENRYPIDESYTDIGKEKQIDRRQVAYNAISWCQKEYAASQQEGRTSPDLEFAEWTQNNQFKMYNNEWTSTKIHYSGDKYTTSELKQLFLNQQKIKE